MSRAYVEVKPCACHAGCRMRKIAIRRGDTTYPVESPRRMDGALTSSLALAGVMHEPVAPTVHSTPVFHRDTIRMAPAAPGWPVEVRPSIVAPRKFDGQKAH